MRVMNRYTPLFSQIVDSSLWLEEDYVCKIFMTMLAKQDADHVVRGTALAIARWSNKTEAEVLKALELLSAPDKQRLEPQPFEGRRIERVAEGWLLLNGAKYQTMMEMFNRRAYDRDRKRREREEEGRQNPRPSRKAQRLQAENESRSRRYVRAEERGDSSGAAAIAAEGLPGGGEVEI